MPKGLALTIGLNSVDPNHYQGWSGVLNACEADATELAEIAKAEGFMVETLLTKSATRKNVTQGISQAAASSDPGDVFLLVYSGHGGQVPDMNNDEDDYQDETWCLYDAELIDDEIFALLGKFAKAVRILVLSDSCHSGSVIKPAFYHGLPGTRPVIEAKQPNFKFMPPDVALATYRQNKDFYQKILKDPTLTKAFDNIEASVLLISGCQDNQYSSDGTFNSLFTATLLAVWNNGLFKENYAGFHKAIVKRMPPDQTPNYFWIGKYDSTFEKQRPFRV